MGPQLDFLPSSNHPNNTNSQSNDRMVFRSFLSVAGIVLAAAAVVAPAGADEVTYLSRQLKTNKDNKAEKKKKPKKEKSSSSGGEAACMLSLTKSEEDKFADFLMFYFRKEDVVDQLLCPTVVDEVVCDGGTEEYLNPCFAILGLETNMTDVESRCEAKDEDNTVCFENYDSYTCTQPQRSKDLVYQFSSMCYAEKAGFAESDCSKTPGGKSTSISATKDPNADFFCKIAVGQVLRACPIDNGVAECAVECMKVNGAGYSLEPNFVACVDSCGSISDKCGKAADGMYQICVPNFDGATVPTNYLNNACLIDGSCEGYVCRPGTNPAEDSPYPCDSEFGFPCLPNSSEPNVLGGTLCPDVCCCDHCLCYFDCTCREDLVCPDWTPNGGLYPY